MLCIFAFSIAQVNPANIEVDPTIHCTFSGGGRMYRIQGPNI